jgi:tetratricopeptide (TPR) repeat protein
VAFESRRFAARVVGIVLAGLLVAACERARPDLSPRALLEKGWGHFRLEEFAEAREAFEAALEKVAPSFPSPPPTGIGPATSPNTATEGSIADAERDSLRLQATYGLALIASLARHGDASAEAHRLFQAVIDGDRSPTREMAAWAALALVRDKALPATADAPIEDPGSGYTAVMERYPETPAAEEAFLYRTALDVETLDPADAQAAIEEIRSYVSAHPQMHWRSALFALQSTAHQTRGEYREALAAAIASVQAREPDPANPRQNNILEYYRIGMMAQFDVGDFATARAYYARFLAEYPRDQRAFLVKLLLEHLDRTEAALRAGKPVPELSAIVHDPVGSTGFSLPVRSTGFSLQRTSNDAPMPAPPALTGAP